MATKMKAMQVSAPRVPGHEVVGVVARCGPLVRGWMPGQRVVQV